MTRSDTVPRTKVSRDLGPLPHGLALSSAHSKTEGLLQVLRSLALKNQREQPRVFYSLREVAKRFRMPVSTVAKIYRDMEHEGLLSRVRGSKTVLNGLRYNRRRVRAFVGLPALLANFVAIPDYRRFFICIRRQLWLRGFASTMVFFRPEEAADGTLRDRLKEHEVDAVIWLFPGQSTKESILRLVDMGVRVVGVSSVGTPNLPSRYFLWRERAIATLVGDWQDGTSSIHITVIDSKEYRSVVTEEVLRVTLQNIGIEPNIRTFTDGDSSVFLRDLCCIKTDGIIFPVAGLASMFAFQRPAEITDLLRAQRVAFIDGPIDIPFVDLPDVSIDVVTFDWQAVAESIVNELITLEAFDDSRHTIFDAQAHLRVPLRSFSEPIRPLRSTGSA